MATNTAKMALRKPATTDTVSVTTDISDNMQKIDDALPTTVCTSGTRPGTPFNGQLIFETDTDVFRIWDSAAWRKVLLGDATTDANSNAPASPSGHRNFFHNGAMQVCQRGTASISFTGGVGGYCVDGIKVVTGTGATNNMQQITTAMGALTLGHRTQKALLWDRTVAGSADSYFWAVIEDVNTLSGKTVTVSWEAWTASGSVDYTVNLTQSFGSGGSPSSPVSNTPTAVKTAGTGTVNVRQSATFTLASVSGKTKGTSNNDALLIEFRRAFGSTNGATGQVYFTNIQIEEGPVATPFEYRSYAAQLADCQRYFIRYISPLATNAWDSIPVARGIGISTTDVRWQLFTPVSMRANGTFTASGAGRAFTSTATAPAISLATGSFFTTAPGNSVYFGLGLSSGGTDGFHYGLVGGSATALTLDLTAEI